MIDVQHVYKTFHVPHEVNALVDVSCKIAAGEVVVVCGPSGSGKSTLLRCLNKLEQATSGHIFIDGIDVLDHKTNINKLRAEVGMVFQSFNLFPHLTVLENCTLAPLWVRKMPQKEAEAVAMKFLERVRIPEQAGKYPGQLSGGQQQRVAIARSLALKPQIILMDEPFSALDEPTRIEMQQLIMELWHEVQATVMIVTHSIAEAVYLGDRVWLMGRAPGRIVREFRDVIPPTRDADPLVVQESAAFKEVVAEVGRAFREIEAGT